MSILSEDDYIASTKQIIPWNRTGVRTTIANAWFTLWDVAGQPWVGTGNLAIGNTANGLVPTSATSGYPNINGFGGAIGYLSRVVWGGSVIARFSLYDRLFAAGAYAFNAAVTLASQPSFSGRIPGGTDYSGLEIWIECVTAFTGSLSVAVTYTNQAGALAHTTGTFVAGALTIGRAMQLPLAAGDTGVQKIESVTASIASAGTFNVMILRPLWSQRIPIANAGDIDDLFKTGMPQLWDTSALYVLNNFDSTAIGVPELDIEVAYK